MFTRVAGMELLILPFILLFPCAVIAAAAYVGSTLALRRHGR